MPALPEYKTRSLLEQCHVPLVPALFLTGIPDDMPEPVVFLKAQIPGATGRAASGLVRRADTVALIREGIEELLAEDGCHGVLAAEAVDIRAEYYAACMLDYGTADRLPGGVLLFSAEGGSGIEERSGSLMRMPFSLIHPPSIQDILSHLAGAEDLRNLAGLLHGMVSTFIRYRLTVLEANPVAELSDGSTLVVDCRAEFEKHAVKREDSDLFEMPEKGPSTLTPLERVVEEVNAADPAGTGFFRASREKAAPGAVPVATNLCGGGGKMLWEMATGGRKDIFTLNESDTSGGLSAFKSYRILRVILSQPEARVLVLTGSGMAFQNQYHLACAVWKALRETGHPVPCLLRFGGTDQEKAFDLFRRIADSLPVRVETFQPEIFPNAMVDRIAEIETQESVRRQVAEDAGVLLFETSSPPARFLYHPERNSDGKEPVCISSCPTGYLRWENGTIRANREARCIGCLVCETVSMLDGNGELTIELEVPGEVL